jgi:hypothetical protein
MPVAVHIPIRLRLPLQALRGGVEGAPDWGSALAAGFGRALTRSHETVLAARGGYVSIKQNPVTFRWTGDAADAVPAGTRAQTEEKIEKLIVALVDNQQRLALARFRRSAPEPLAGFPAEKVDPDRLSKMAGIYMVPSYCGPEGNKEGLEIEGEEIEAPLPEGFVEVDTWDPYDGDYTVRKIFLYKLAKLSDLPTEGYLGVLYKPVGNPGYRFVILEFRGEANRIAWTDGFTNVTSKPIWDEKKRKFITDMAVGLPPSGEYVLEEKYDASSFDARKKAIEDALGPGLREEIEWRWTPPKGMKPEDAPAAREKIYQEQLDNMAHGSEKATGFLLLRSPIGQLLLQTSARYVARFLPLPISLIPLSRKTVIKEKVGDKKGEGDDNGGSKEGGTAGEAKSGADQGGTGQHKGTGGEGGSGEGEGGGEGGSGEGEGGGEGGSGKGGSGPGFEDGSSDARESIVSFPPSFGFGYIFDCVPFEDELPVDELGEYATGIKRIMQQIAFRLQIPMCRFPGTFCIHAAKSIGGRARDVAFFAEDDVGATTVADSNTANLGNIEFTPTDSPAVQFLRHLAGTMPYITRLERSIADAYSDSANSSRLGGMYKNNPTSWLLHFYEESTPAAKESVGWIFLYGCQILMLQLLRASREGIEARLDPAVFPKYAAFFEDMVFFLLADQAELIELRETLNTYLAATLSSTEAVATEAVNTWRRMHRIGTQAGLVGEGLEAGRAVDVSAAGAQWADAQSSLLSTMAGAIEGKTANNLATGGELRGQIVETKAGPAIRDGKGRLWTAKDLDNAIALGQGTAESIDPLVKQLLDLPGIMPLFKQNPWLVKIHLKNMLEEMRKNNEEVTQKTIDSPPFAFEHGRIQEDATQSSTIPGTLYQLQGIHRVVHEHIGDAFMGDGYYALGINQLFAAEQGFESLTSGMIFIGLILLAVICPPAAFWAGVALSLHELEKAEETKQIYGSLVDPEELVSKMEMEIELFMAELGVALSFIPEAGSIFKKVSSAGEAIAKQGLRKGLKTVGRRAVQEVLEEIAKQLKKNLLAAVLRELAINVVFDKIMSVMIEPVIAAMEAQIAGPDLAALPALGGEEGAEEIDWDAMPESEDNSEEGDGG